MKRIDHWTTQFPAEFNIPPILCQKFDDNSWRNDVCPTFYHRNTNNATSDGTYPPYVLWADAEQPEERELGPIKRFRIVYSNDAIGVCDTMLETDDVNEAVAFFESLLTQ